MDVLSCEVSFEEIIKGSRFLSELIPCTSQTQAREIIKFQKAKYADSTHVVHAFIVGHNAEIMEDDKKQTWIIYHGYLRKQPEKRRMVFMSQVKWKDGWPYVDGGVPAKEAPAPYFKKSKKK